jgi:amino acid adenylation domain-containing protein
LNLAALEESFNEIVHRHEGLRTSFGLVEGQPVQMVASHFRVRLPLICLQQLPVNERETTAKRLITQEIKQPFNLAQGPLLRLLLLQLSETEYVLVINLHHIIFDEWSIALLVKELGTLYPAFNAGQPSTLSPLLIQYADFAHWQRQCLQGDVLELQLAYWRQQLKNLSILELPSDRPRPLQPSYRGDTQLVEVSKDVTAALQALSQQAGVTLFMTLLAAFQVLLFRYTGQTDIAVGSPIANRNRRELEDLIGFFANSLVLRTDLSANPTFREVLGRVREVAVGAYAHQDLPFEKLVADLHPERHLSCNPLFQVVFALQNAPMEQLALPELTLRSFQLETTTTRFDLELYLWECSENFRSLWGEGWQQSEGLRGVLVYSTDLFDKQTIARLVQHWQTLLAAAVADPDTRLADLPLLSTREQHQLLGEWNQTQRPYPAHLSIQQLFEAQVAQSPNAIAVQFGEQKFTYQELNRGSNQLAHYLRRLGVGCETLVGICMKPCSAMVAGLLAILKAGGAYLPIDPTSPPERLQFMLEDAQVSVLLTQENFRLPSIQNLQVVYLDRDWPAIAQQSQENLIHQTLPDNLAYVVYTSGSTGTPKGVAVPHRAVNRLVCNTNYITLEPGDKVAQSANISFDAATFEIWGALLNGAQLIGMAREVVLCPQKFASEIQRQEISVLFLTTALFNQLAREVPSAFHSLRYLLFGGEAVDVRWVQAVLQQGAPEHLLHVYGPTENTTFSTWYQVRTLLAGATTVPIGRAIANTQIYLLDTNLHPVPIGVTGEIYLGGDGLARGYLHRAALTAERFIVALGCRLYKTGDLARYLPDGNLEFLGRTDQQVKLRGFRIELGEIEVVLTQHPLVQAAVAIVREDTVGDQRLVAYLVSHPEQSFVTSELRSFLKRRLPDYMVPAAFVRLAALPLTGNGKVDRHRLPPPAGPSSGLTAISLSPRSSVEAELTQLWREILGLEQVGIHDNFFDLGGHSLLATQLLSRVRDRLQVQVPLRSLFAAPTIAELAQAIETMDWSPQDLSIADGQAIATAQREEVEF